MTALTDPDSDDPPTPQKLRLLLAEDEPSTLEFLGEILSPEYEVSAFLTGKQAWAAAQNAPPDVVLSDLHLPDLDGISLTRKLRANAGTAITPIILLTASNKVEMLLEGLEAGADDFLLKPFRPQELLARLRSIHRLIEVRRSTIEQAARREAELVDQAKNHFLAALSHELRTPLTPVQLAVYMLGKEKGLSASMRDGLAMISRNVEIEIKLIDDLLDISRIVHGKLEMSLSAADLSDCLSRALDISRPEFVTKGVKLTFNLSARRQMRSCDGTRLEQVFGKLLQNAVKYTPAGGDVSASIRDSSEGVVVEIKDNGWGIEAAALPKLFSVFQQGDPDEVRRYGGLGLGLAISHAIVTAHGGTLSVSSAGRNQGATFLVELPTMKSAHAA